MLILANTLEFNGGTTFILRFCKENFQRGKNTGVLCMTGNSKSPLPLHHEISKYADIYYISDNANSLVAKYFCNTPLAGFLPIKSYKVRDIIQKYSNNVHVMGVFGLLFMARYIKETREIVNISAGVYHQNEFMFNSNRLFSKHAHDLFKSLGENGVIFFNEANVRSYSKFFNMDYRSASISPIGIEIPNNDNFSLGSYNSNRIVSIGNLVNFKTYNSHIIKLLPRLLKLNPRLRYEIYGDGPCKQDLIKIAKEFGVFENVIFRGTVEYSKFSTAVNNSFLFVGSGTAVIEAAALGIPSMIGIESSKEPITYGFINEIEGYSYNEYDPNRCSYNIYDRIESLIENVEYWEKISIACKRKAVEFSINNTVDIFEDNCLRFTSLDVLLVNKYSNCRLLFSFLYCAFLDLINFDKSFSNRRNQGSLA
ncbi:TPA: glycosyltransferase [Vibrio cholerae]